MARPRKLPTAGEQLEAILLSRGLSRLDLCAKIQASPAAVSRWISGTRKPSLRLALKLRAELGIELGVWESVRATEAA